MMKLAISTAQFQAMTGVNAWFAIMFCRDRVESTDALYASYLILICNLYFRGEKA
jgi:hypothetical protein